MVSCTKNNNAIPSNTSTNATVLPPQNKLLTLKIDYLTNTFEGALETIYSNPTSSFTISKQYKTPGDFGYINFFYQEFNQLIFDGEIIWMEKGNLIYPTSFIAPSQFSITTSPSSVTPSAGFENLDNTGYAGNNVNFYAMWGAIQNLALVRSYLNSNPTCTVKYFLYTPSVGVGNPADWDWIVFIKN